MPLDINIAHVTVGDINILEEPYAALKVAKEASKERRKE